MKRGEFIRLTAGMAVVAPLVNACDGQKRNAAKTIPGKIVGASAAAGHLLRDHAFNPPSEFETKEVVIIGAGVSGLSAARHLVQQGIEDIVVLDLEAHPGGNAASGGNAFSKYPWGAHYVPVPNNNLTDYLAFLEDAKVITGYDQAGLPVYDEFFLCHDPEERLYINGHWQEGLVPNFGLNAVQLAEFKTFFKFINHFKNLKGADGLDAFSIPVDTSSRDESLRALDRVTMKEWMDNQNLSSEYIRWYVDYCTRDDFGTPFDQVSAWAGIHYFASRKGKAANAQHNDVLTWENGNGFLIDELRKLLDGKINTGALATSVKTSANGVKISYLDVASRQLKGLEAKHCIMAVPQFVAARLLSDTGRGKALAGHFHYVPWMVANLTVKELHERSGQPASWDNVIYGSPSLGYVDATHQQVQQRKERRNLTYYLPLTHASPEVARREAYRAEHAFWAEKVLSDLQRVHPDIREQTERIDIMLWGHAMAQPRPGMVHGDVRKTLANSIGNAIHFAHTDLAGVSIFEEGFYQGLNAAKKILQQS
ncbi:Protoporphyrinogen oxidase [Dyadobacter sp. SG02]|uniref:flavin monoamine oxidase family protein n=1 Tax=Dyadobacter sp. SG02 TaxID=1855291 RepID=UPI0008D7949E|nr:FAD-dependent oxidoreductase [Dyadobacter sp. SG02]SEJ84866.1 Protoporphyrinogen oxidase [Dyadobacter sp. SG02]